MTSLIAKLHYCPAPIQLGGNMSPGAQIKIEGLDCGPVSGVVESESPHLGICEQLGEDWLPALTEAAQAGVAGRSGTIEIDLADFFPW